MSEQQWKSVKLEVSNLGNVRFLGKSVAIVNRNGRRNRDGKVYKGVMLTLHRLVAAAFHGLPPAHTKLVNHIDGNPENNCADNLEWVSAQQNRVRSSRGVKGESYWNTKLTEAQVKYIRSQRPKRFPEWAESLGVSLTAIHFVRKGRTKHPRFATTQEAETIRTQLTNREMAGKLGEQFGITRNNVYHIWNRKTWKHVK